MSVDLQSLELFLKVAELGSIGLAAEAMGIRQPSATDRLKRLEREFGVVLMRRSPRGTSLTGDGVAVAGWANEVVAASDRLAESVRALHLRHDGHLQICSSGTVAEHLMPRLLADLRDEVPNVRVKVRVCNSQQVVQEVISGRVELGFIGTPDVPDDLYSRILVDDPLVVVIPTTHRWAGVATVDIKELTHEPLIVHEPGAGTRETLDRAFASLRHAWDDGPRLELGSTATIKAAAAEGQGVGVVSRLTMSQGGADPRLRSARITGADVTRHIRMLWNRSVRLSTPSRALVKVATKHANSWRCTGGP